MEIFTVYHIEPLHPRHGFGDQTTEFDRMRKIVDRYLNVQRASVKVTVTFARTDRFHRTRQALVSIFEVENEEHLKDDEPVKYNVIGASIEELEEVSHWGPGVGVPREFYDRDPLWG